MDVNTLHLMKLFNVWIDIDFFHFSLSIQIVKTTFNTELYVVSISLPSLDVLRKRTLSNRTPKNSKNSNQINCLVRRYEEVDRSSIEFGIV